MYIFEFAACIAWIASAFYGFPIALVLAAITYTNLAAIWHIVVYLIDLNEKVDNLRNEIRNRIE